VLSGTRGFHFGDEIMKVGCKTGRVVPSRRIPGDLRVCAGAFLARPTRESIPEANARTARVESATRMKESGRTCGRPATIAEADFTDSP